MRTSTFIIKKNKNPNLNSKSFSKLKTSETEVSRKQYLYWKLSTSTNVKSIYSHCRPFQQTIFFVGNHSGRHFSEAGSPPLQEPVTASVYPKITLNQLEH